MVRGKYFLVCFFCFTLVVPFLGDLLNISTLTLEENRNIGPRVAVSLKDRVSLYIKNFDSKFWGREYLLKAYIAVKKDIFQISPLPEKVILGKEGWLFLVDYGAMDDYRNLNPFENAQLDSIQQYLTTIADSLEKKNKKFYVVVVPDKHTIYPEFLPDNIKKINPVSRLQQVSARLKSSSAFHFIDLTDILLLAKRKEQVYFKEESHWNDRGAFVSNEYLMKVIKKDFPDIEVLTIEECDVFKGEEADIDLMKLLGKDITYAEPTIRIVPRLHVRFENVPTGIVIPKSKQFNPYYSFRKVNPNADGQSAIVFRDSFFASMVPFFERSFSTSSYIWTTNVDVDYSLREDANIVVLELAERHLYLITH